MLRNIVCLVILFALVGFTPNKKEKWISLFNGKNLEHWKPKIAGFPLNDNHYNTFVVEDGILHVRYTKYDSFRNQFGALYYDRKFRNFRLRAEYRFVGETTVGAPSWGYRDSGIQYYGQAPESIGLKQSFPICLEYNLHGGNGKDENPVGELCANGIYVEVNGARNKSYCTAPSVKKTFHGDQWVTLEIDVHDGNFKHFVNGQEILSFTNPRYDLSNDISKSLATKGEQVTDGYISLQSNSHPIDFRKIEILEYE